MRKDLCKDFGYDEKSRIENIKRAKEVSLMMVDARTIIIVAFISPFGSEKAMVRTLFMDTPLEIAEKKIPRVCIDRYDRME